MPLVTSHIIQAWRRTGGGWMSQLRPACIWGLLVFVVLFGVLRNLAAPQFSPAM
jgi:hypothetical protein